MFILLFSGGVERERSKNLFQGISGQKIYLKPENSLKYQLVLPTPQKTHGVLPNHVKSFIGDRLSESPTRPNQVRDGGPERVVEGSSEKGDKDPSISWERYVYETCDAVTPLNTE